MPDFAQNGKFYLIYEAPALKKGNPCRLVVSKFRVGPADPEWVLSGSRREILSLESPSIIEEGCQVFFGADRYLYISLGDIDTVAMGSHCGGQAQSLHFLIGKILRINMELIRRAGNYA